MKVVVDTNVLLVCISPRSASHWLWQIILSGEIEVYVTIEILAEYNEIIGQRMGSEVADAALDLLLELPNVHLIQKYYAWQLIEVDHDDDKFVDCAIAANAQYLVSNDKHLKELDKYPYFNISVIQLEAFKVLFTT